MAETSWTELQGKTLRYRDQTWELTGSVDVRESGELLAVEANRDDDVRRETATLYFGIETPSDSLNPGDPGEHFDRLEERKSGHYLIAKKEQQTYRYELQRLEYS